jgi:hypothetical protein
MYKTDDSKWTKQTTPNVQNRQLQMYKTDNSKSKKQMLFYLYLDRRFDQIEFSRSHFDFFQGDSILVECTYDSTRKNKPTVVSKNKSFGIVCFVHLESSVLYIWSRLFCTFGVVCFVGLFFLVESYVHSTSILSPWKKSKWDLEN